MNEVNRILRMPPVITNNDVGTRFILVRRQMNFPSVSYSSQVREYMGKRTNAFNVSFMLFKNVDTAEIIVYPSNVINHIYREEDIQRIFKGI
jgi:hypothetical protein